MASLLRFSREDAVNTRQAPKSKQSTCASPKFTADARGVAIATSHMSPEAERAMLMTQEDAKENTNSIRNMKQCNRSKQDNTKSSSSNNKVIHRDAMVSGNVGDVKFSVRNSLKTTALRPRGLPRSRKLVSFGSTILTTTTRSRSTLSLTERNFSISDNTDSCCNYNSSMKPKCVEFASRVHRNNGGDLQHAVDTLTNNGQESKQLEISVGNDVNENSNEVSENSKSLDKATHPGSFVLALDRVLEEKQISRLRGDITDTSVINEPGKVRALDGGRLTNAQEVVVNVCHDDDRELVFHDNDDEAMNNARAVSEIRINLWMKYNEDFQQDNAIDDIDLTENNIESGEQSKGKAKDIVSIGTIQRHRENADRSWPSAPAAVSRLSSSFKKQLLKKDASNSGAIKPKVGKRTGTKDNSFTKGGSNTLYHAFKQNCSPAKKDANLKS